MSGYEPGLSETANDVFDGIEGLGAVAGAGGDYRVLGIAMAAYEGHRH